MTQHGAVSRVKQRCTGRGLQARLMNRPTNNGRIGSQRLLQVAVAEYPDLLNQALKKAGAISNSETVAWTSPLSKDQFKEFQDQAALEKIGVANFITYPLSKFWPKGGPVWDATGITNSGRSVLVEAKAHIPEAASPASGASPKSLAHIEASLEAARKHYAPKSSTLACCNICTVAPNACRSKRVIHSVYSSVSSIRQIAASYSQISRPAGQRHASAARLVRVRCMRLLGSLLCFHWISPAC